VRRARLTAENEEEERRPWVTLAYGAFRQARTFRAAERQRLVALSSHAARWKALFHARTMRASAIKIDRELEM